MAPRSDAMREGALSLVDKCDVLLAKLVNKGNLEGSVSFVSALIRVAEGLMVSGAVNTALLLLQKAAGWLEQGIAPGATKDLLETHVRMAMGVADTIRGGEYLTGAKAKLRKTLATTCTRPAAAAPYCETDNNIKLRATLGLAWVNIKQNSAEGALKRADEVLDNYLASCGKVQVLSALVVCAIAYEGCVLYSYADALACWDETVEIVNAAGKGVEQFFDRKLLDEEARLCRLRSEHKLPRAAGVGVARPLLDALLPSALCNTSSIPLVLLQRCLLQLEELVGVHSTEKSIATSPPRLQNSRTAVRRSTSPSVQPVSKDKTISRHPTKRSKTGGERSPPLMQHRTLMPLSRPPNLSPYLLPSERKGSAAAKKAAVRTKTPNGSTRAGARAPHPPGSPKQPTKAEVVPSPGSGKARPGNGYSAHAAARRSTRQTSADEHGTPGSAPEIAPAGRYFDAVLDSGAERRLRSAKDTKRRHRATRSVTARSPEQLAAGVTRGTLAAGHRGVMKVGVVGMAFDAVQELLVRLDGWRAVPGAPAHRDYSSTDIFLGEKLPVEALIESCFLRIRRRHPSQACTVADRKRPLYVNYFLGSRMMTLKSKMVELLRAQFDNPYDITPLTYILLPHGADERREFLSCNRPAIWIAKSSHGSKGLNVKISRDKRDIMRHVDGQDKQLRWVVQEYLQDPFLIHGRKFDIRTWVVMTPDRSVWVYRRGVCRTSSYEYSKASLGSLDDHLTHLTNHHIQERGQRFSMFEEGNEMWFHQFDAYMRALPEPRNYYRDIEPQLNDLTRKMFQAVATSVHRTPEPLRSFQLFGFDFMVDKDLRCWLLEVNGSPAIAEYLKDDMVSDMCELVFEGTSTASALIERRGERRNDFVRLIHRLDS